MWEWVVFRKDGGAVTMGSSMMDGLTYVGFGCWLRGLTLGVDLDVM